MRRSTLGAAAALAIGVALAAPAAAQRHGPGPHAGPGAMQGPMHWDSSAVTTIGGTILSVDTVPGMRPGMAGLHLTLRTRYDTIAARLGPTWFVAREGVTLAPGDRVEIRGARVGSGGPMTLIAERVTRGRAALVLRDTQGRPRWAGQGPMQGGMAAPHAGMARPPRG